MRNREHDSKRRTEKPWRALYNTAQWKALRLAQLRREPLCKRCSDGGRIIRATVAHHKVAHKGDATLFFDPSNLASSCKDCHDSVEQGIEARGYESGCDLRGRPIASDHPWNQKR
ncbi:HNH endonuclease [Bradyrhizobium sp. 18]|nr:HNH endonuclease [Bradyrhizobium sp. 18]